MIKELGELNEKFYELYRRLYENGELLTPKQAALMADNLLARRAYSPPLAVFILA